MVNTIGTCLNSIASQNPNEIVVIDGNSTDGTSQKVEEYNVKHLFDDKRGLPAARNMGLANCSSEYVAIVDGDQWLSNGFHNQLLALLNKEDADVVFCKEIWLGKSQWAKAMEAQWEEVSSMRKDWVYWPRVIKLDLIKAAGGYDECLYGFEDIDLWERIKKLNPHTLSSRLIIYSDASDISPVTSFRRGVYSYVSVARFLSKHSEQWQKVLSIAPLGFFTDTMLTARLLIRTHNISVASKVFCLRISMSMGRLVSVLLAFPITNFLLRIPAIRTVSRVPNTKIRKS